LLFDLIPQYLFGYRHIWTQKNIRTNKWRTNRCNRIPFLTSL